MKSVFRVYARANKGNDSYLYNQLLSYGLKPKYQELLPAFYFNANFNHIFQLSFQSFITQSMYVQLGHKFPLTKGTAEFQKNLAQYFRKINFKNFIAMKRGTIENITLKILIRESSISMPSENAIFSIFQNHLQKQIILKQYRSMIRKQQNKTLENYYDIKQIVEKKWQYEDAVNQQKQLLLQSAQTKQKQQLKLIGNQKTPANQILQNNSNQKGLGSLQRTYEPHFILYIRRNHARLLLKINREPMHKFGWKKQVNWAPIRQTLTASILYKTGLIDQFKKQRKIQLWDPFCGSSTIAIVTLAMILSLNVRQNFKDNFVWHHWPIYHERYLQQFKQNKKEQNKSLNINIFASDIDISAVRSSLNNLKQLISKNQAAFNLNSKINKFMLLNPADQIFQVKQDQIFVGCGDFQEMIQKIDTSGEGKINIVTNLPYLGERSKKHHPIKQLVSIYRRFNQMINKNQSRLQNVFVVIDTDVKNRNHFIQVSTVKWRIIEKFINGGIQVYLLGWEGNKTQCKQLNVIQENSNKDLQQYRNTRRGNLQQYRSQIKQINKRKYELPQFMVKYRRMRGSKRVMQKIKARQLRAAYSLFARRKDKNQTYQSYARKNLALRLSERGKTWRKKNISMLGNELKQSQDLIKKQFETRVQQAVKRSQQLKDKRKGEDKKAKRKW